MKSPSTRCRDCPPSSQTAPVSCTIMNRTPGDLVNWYQRHSRATKGEDSPTTDTPGTGQHDDSPPK